jgi:hypothetical protein
MSMHKNSMRLHRMLIPATLFGCLSLAPDRAVAEEQPRAVPSVPDSRPVWSPWIGSPRGNATSPVRSGDENPSRATVAGNPLWNVPLSSLHATRELPIFSASRRPPVISHAPSATPPPVVADRSGPPKIALVGAIAGEANGMAIFLDGTTKAVVRLKTGESYLGWRLLSVTGREATLQKDKERAILALSALPAQ